MQGVTLSGVMIDYCTFNDVEQPYTTVLVLFTLLTALALPCFYYAGRRFNHDRDLLSKKLAGQR